MTIRQFRGDAPAISRQQLIPRPAAYVAGSINLKINNKIISVPQWDVTALVKAWNGAKFFETQNITASAVVNGTAQYGVEEALLLTADNPGEDFFVDAYIDDSFFTNEKQVITFDPKPDGGTFTLNFSGQTTSAITFSGDMSITASNVQTALIALSNIAPGDVVVTPYGTTNKAILVTFGAAYASLDVPLLIVDYTNLTGGDVQLAVSTVTEGILPYSEVQTLTIPSAPTGGTFTLTYEGQTTSAIAYNASAATVQTALRALSTIGSPNVVCAGGALPTAITITFAGTLANKDVSLITANGGSLTGGTSNISGISTVRQGSNTGTNEKWRFAYVGGNVYNPTGRSARWCVYGGDPNNPIFSSSFPTTASAATIAAALAELAPYVSVGGYPIGETFNSGDITITGSLLTTGSSGGITVEFTSDKFKQKTGFGTFTIPGFFLVDSTSTLLSDPFQLYAGMGPIEGVHGFVQSATGAGSTKPGSGIPIQYASEAHEIQQYTVTNPSLPGSYSINVYDSSGVMHTTDQINYSDLTDVIQSKINAALGGNYVTVGGGGPYVIEYKWYGYQIANITQMTVNDNSVSIEETTKGYAGVKEVQQIIATVSPGHPVRAGSFTISYGGQTTGSLAYNANNNTIQSALWGLSSIADGDVLVTGGPVSSGLLLTWLSSLGNIAPVTVANSLVNSMAVVTEYITGGVAIYSREVTKNRGPNCFDDPSNYDPKGLPTDGDTINVEFCPVSIKWGTKQRDTFTVFSTTNNILELGTRRPLFQNDQKLLVLSTGTAPGGLTAGTAYFVVNADDRGRFQLSTSQNGSAIDITNAGTGVHTIGLHLAALVVPARFNDNIGLPRVISETEEYRPRYLEVFLDKFIMGERGGNASSLVRIDTGNQPVVNGITILATASSQEANVPAVCMLCNEATIDISIYGGSFGLAPFLDETSVVRDITGHNCEVVSIGGTVCRNIDLTDSTLIGKFTPSGTAVLH